MDCVLCKSATFRFLFERKQFRIEKCVSCDLVQVTNVPAVESLQNFYDKSYFDSSYASLSDNRAKQRYVYVNFENKLDQIEGRVGKRGKLLDIGCSFGFFLDAARKRGWAVEGIDMSAYAVEYAGSRLNLPVKNGCITEADFAKQSFDVITMWDVIEHLANPKETLKGVSECLKGDGMLVVSTPDVDSFRARLEGKRWRVWVPPDHLLYFSPRTMGRLCELCNLEIIDEETAVPYEKYMRKIKLYTLLDKLKLSDKVIYYVKKREPLSRQRPDSLEQAVCER